MKKNQAILNGPCPSMTEGLSRILQYQRQNGRFNKPAVKEEEDYLEQIQSSQRSTVGGMFRKRAENIAGTNWEILEYKLDPTKPGDLKVYVRAGDKVHTFNFHVPKRVYASFKTKLSQRKSIPGCEIEESNAILPNGHDGTNLYKLTMAQSVSKNK